MMRVHILKANRRRLRHIKPKPKRKSKVLSRHPAYTVAALRKKNNAELAIIAKILAVDYRLASSEKKAALGTLITFIAGIIEERRKEK